MFFHAHVAPLKAMAPKIARSRDLSSVVLSCAFDSTFRTASLVLMFVVKGAAGILYAFLTFAVLHSIANISSWKREGSPWMEEQRWFSMLSLLEESVVGDSVVLSAAGGELLETGTLITRRLVVSS